MNVPFFLVVVIMVKYFSVLYGEAKARNEEFAKWYQIALCVYVAFVCLVLHVSDYF